jgi:short-subunit dehydrogenase
MIKNVLLLGASGGIGSNVYNLMQQSNNYHVEGWSSKNLDLNYPENIFDCNFSKFDLLINCAGHNQGSYLGFLKNSWQNQISQITVNYISNLMLLKHYANSRRVGKFVWISTSSIDSPRIYHSVYTGTKVASKFSIDLIAQEATHIDILEAKVGLTKTNIRYRNFEGTKTHSEVDETYGNSRVLDASDVATQIYQAIDKNLKKIIIL